MGRLALIPAAPVLLADVDRAESARIAWIRATIAEVLASSSSWALPVDALPPLLGLGGFGIDRGVDTRTGVLLDDADWVRAVDALDDAEYEACLAAHPSLTMAALHAHAAGVSIGPAHTSESVLAPIDLSAAASADAPLAPVPGAKGFDARVVGALRNGDAPSLRSAAGDAAEFHADLDLLSAALDLLDADGRELREVGIVVDEDVHEVRTLCAVIGC